jgi:hypothetical protein
MTVYFEEGSPAMVELEKMVDAVGLVNVLFALEHICSAKSDHIQMSYGTSRHRDPAAVLWNAASLIVRATAYNGHLRQLPYQTPRD